MRHSGAGMDDSLARANPGPPRAGQSAGKRLAHAVSVPEKVPPTAGERLTDIRIRAGYGSREKAWRAINKGMKEEEIRRTLILYHQHENGLRTITIEAAAKYAQHFGVQPNDILYGDASRFRLRVVGIVGADGIVLKARATQTVVAPPIETGMAGGFSALVIEDRKLIPMCYPGDAVYFHKATFRGPVDPRVIAGRKCIIQTQAGSTVLAFVEEITPDGKANLRLPSGKERKNVPLLHAAPIVWTRHLAN